MCIFSVSIYHRWMYFVIILSSRTFQVIPYYYSTHYVIFFPMFGRDQKLGNPPSFLDKCIPLIIKLSKSDRL